MSTTLFTMLMLTSFHAGEDSKSISENFETATVGSVPKGWSVAKTGTGEGSKWSITEDRTSPHGSKVLSQTAASPDAVFNLCVVDDSQFQNLTISVSFKANHGKNDQGGGVVWRYLDNKNYYVARFNPLENNYRLYHVKDGKRTQIGAKEELVAKAGEWHTLSIKMINDTITCSLNGKQYIEVKDTTFTKPGQVGLWTKADAQTAFDGFEVKGEK